jgi:outer membrane protein TolC
MIARPLRTLAGAAALAASLSPTPAEDRPGAVRLPVERWVADERPEPAGPASPLDLGTALARARERDDRLAQRRALADAADQRAVQARSLDDPRLSFRQHIDGVQTRTGEQRFAIGVRQSLPWPGTLSLREARSGELARAARLDAAATGLDTERRVREVFHRLAHRLAARDLTARERAVVRRIFDTASSAYAAGDGSRAAMLKAQATLARLESRLAEHDGRIAELRAALREWIGAPPEGGGSWVPTPDRLPLVNLDPAALEQAALRHRPELRGLARERQAAGLDRQLARREAYPDLSLGLDWIGIGDRPDDPVPPPPDEGDDAWSVSVSLNLPVFAGRREAAEREAAHRERAIGHRTRDAERSIRASLRGLAARLDALGEQLTLIDDTVIPLAEESFAAARSAYAAGEGSFLDLLDAERMLLDARDERLRLMRDYRIALAELERTVGAELVFDGEAPPAARSDDDA